MRGILLGLLLASSLTALAGEADSLQQKYDAAFLEMYEDIGNLDKTFRLPSWQLRSAISKVPCRHWSAC